MSGTWMMLDDAKGMLEDARTMLEDAGRMVEGARAMAIDTGRPVVVASQVHRYEVSGRRNAIRLAAKSFGLLFKGRTTLSFRRKM